MEYLQGCMNLTYDPYDFAVVARLFFGEAMLFERSFSGKNPPPLCMPIPLPPVFPNMDFCARFYDIYTPGRNLHLCMDWEARLQRAPVVRLRFDCVRVGLDGLVLLKPEDGDGFTSTSSAPADAFATTTAAAIITQDPDSVYDPVAPGRGTDATMTTTTEDSNEDENRSTTTESSPTTIISTMESSLTTTIPTTESSPTNIITITSPT